MRLALFILAYNLGNFPPCLVLLQRMEHWPFRTLLTKLIKVGAKVAYHSRIVTFQIEEIAVREFSPLRSTESAFGPGSKPKSIGISFLDGWGQGCEKV